MDKPRGKSHNRLLPVSFYSRHTVVVARELLGKILCRRLDGKILSGRIVETEAYLGQGDPASHAFRGPTPRSSIMFGPPGRAYVYFVYGNHHCFNIVAHNGEAGAILVRALEPISGVPEMMKRRKAKILENLTNGPGKLTQAMGITRAENGADLADGNLMILDAPSTKEIILASPRVGVRTARAKPYRFSLRGNVFVSSPGPR